MRITLTETGGWGAALPPTVNAIDLDRMDAETAREGRALVTRLFQSSAPSSDVSHERDATEFTVSVDEAGNSSVVSSTSAGLSREFAEFLNWFKRHA